MKKRLRAWCALRKDELHVERFERHPGGEDTQRFAPWGLCICDQKVKNHCKRHKGTRSVTHSPGAGPEPSLPSWGMHSTQVTPGQVFLSTQIPTKRIELYFSSTLSSYKEGISTLYIYKNSTFFFPKKLYSWTWNTSLSGAGLYSSNTAVVSLSCERTPPASPGLLMALLFKEHILMQCKI